MVKANRFAYLSCIFLSEGYIKGYIDYCFVKLSAQKVPLRASLGAFGLIGPLPHISVTHHAKPAPLTIRAEVLR